jgi:hypothetical protein
MLDLDNLPNNKDVKYIIQDLQTYIRYLNGEKLSDGKMYQINPDRIIYCITQAINKLKDS